MAVLVFVVLVVALLAVPLSVTYDVSTRTGYRNDITIGWAFDLFRFRVPTDRLAPAAEDDRAERPSTGAASGLAAIRQQAFRRRLFRFAGDLWRAVHKEDFRLHARIGLGDPADTGQLWAVVGPIAGMLGLAEGAAISVTPDFFEATLILDSHGRMRLVPLHVVYLAIALMLSPSIWRGVVAMKRAA